MHYSLAWQRLWRDLGAPGADLALLRELIQRYSEPRRKYHTLQHLDACFAHLAALRTQAEQPEEVELALWFHDAVYEIGALDNERVSADWARSAMLAARLCAPAAQRVHALVMATCHAALPGTTDEAILIDVDLAILGAPAHQFDAYEAQVRAEYATMPEARFRSGRRRILQQFLEREHIYHTEYFSTRREARARANLQRSIALLGD